MQVHAPTTPLPRRRLQARRTTKRDGNSVSRSALDRAWRDLIATLDNSIPALGQVARERQAAGCEFHKFVNDLLACSRASHFSDAFDAATAAGRRLSYEEMETMREEAYRRFPDFDRQWPGGPRVARHSSRTLN